MNGELCRNKLWIAQEGVDLWCLVENTKIFQDGWQLDVVVGLFFGFFFFDDVHIGRDWIGERREWMIGRGVGRRTIEKFDQVGGSGRRCKVVRKFWVEGWIDRCQHGNNGLRCCCSVHGEGSVVSSSDLLCDVMMSKKIYHS